MKESQAWSNAFCTQQWHSANWYAALTLTERVALSKEHPKIDAFDDTQRIAQAIRRLQTWKQQPPFNQEKIFTQRLAQERLSEEEFSRLLAETVESLQARALQNGSSLEWMATLSKAFEEKEGNSNTDWFMHELSIDPDTGSYLSPLLPLCAYGFMQLEKGIQDICRRTPFRSFESRSIARILFKPLPHRLISLMSKTFVLEMHIAGLQQQLPGDTPRERFIAFVSQLSQRERIVAFLEEYPVLARLLVLTLEHWIAYACEFFEHLYTDWDDLCARFMDGQDPGSVIEVSSGVGDPHRQGRTVLMLTFSSGRQLVYKPRSLAIDVHFQELLIWLNEQGAKPAFCPLTILDRGSYGWVECVSPSSCIYREQVERFYERQGAYLALLYALNASDLHMENIIAAGEHPILIDLEALFHPRVQGEDPTQPFSLGLYSLEQSVFRVGLLPNRIWSNQERIGVDLSGLGGQQGQQSPRPIPQWEAAGTDQMRLVRHHIEIPVRQNRPQLQNQEVHVLEFSKHIITGFIRMYRLLQSRNHEIIADLLPRFAHDEIRLILRPTQRYATLLTESVHPDLLRDALARDRFFDHLWREVELRPYLTRVLPAERCDLLEGDIPLFTTQPGSRTILTTAGKALLDFFDEPSLEIVKQRLLSLNEQDLVRQCWIIEATLSTLLIGPEQVIGKTLHLHPTTHSASYERLLAAACAVGERLEHLAMRNAFGACWLGVSPVSERAWSLLPTESDLYSGTSGIALFLSYLGIIKGEKRYTALARSALASVRSHVEQQKKTLSGTNISAFSGLGSALYLLMHLSVLWKEPALLQEAEDLGEFLPTLLVKDEQLDIVGGAGGCLLNLLSLYEVHPTKRTLSIARQCGDHLLHHAQSMSCGVAWKTIKQEVPLAGFAHGTAGIAFSLLKLSAMCGEERYRKIALEALAYERGLYLPAQKNWADLRRWSPDFMQVSGENQRAKGSQKSEIGMVAWCHGAAGIGLGRLASLKYVDDQMMREEIEIALATTLRSGMSENHSLCHGIMGNIDVLLTATQILDLPFYQAAIEQTTAMVLESIDEQGWISGVPLGVETPGLMTGLAGIGYQLLRLACPEKVPSVLLLAPPSRESNDMV